MKVKRTVCRLVMLVILMMTSVAGIAQNKYRIVKAGDAASLLKAIEEANSSSEVHKYIYVPNGTYDLGKKVLTAITGDNISIVGESRDGVIIVNTPDAETESISNTATLLNTATGTYLQDLTLKNDLDYYKNNNGRAVALWDKGTKTVCRNVRLLSHQDTYYSNRKGGQYYFEGGEIHGTVDFICGGGNAYFKDVLLFCEQRNTSKTGTDAITANNSVATDKGYVFEGCTIKTDNVPVVSLGRSWGNTPKVAYLNTKVVSPETFSFTSSGVARWTLKGMNVVPEQFLEYNTTDMNGTLLSPTSNLATFKWTDKKDASNVVVKQLETIMPSTDVTKFSYKNFFTDWDPASVTLPFAKPTAWDTEYPAIEKSIQSVQLHDAEFLITKYGAKTTASAATNTKAINKAIHQCNKKGGGRVVVPAGVWKTGALTLLSNVNLVIEKGATLEFAFELDLYPVAETHWEGLGCYNISPLIYANGQHDIAITGEGTIDGGATTDAWWFWQGSKERFGWRPGRYSQQASRTLLQEQSENGTPVSERRFTKDNPMRPQSVNLMNCQRVLIQGVTLLRSPFWVLHPCLCEDVTVRGVKIVNDGPNGDGCDPESCQRVLIEDCVFDTGDDCIAIKSGRNKDGRMWNVTCENVIVRNCKMVDGHGGVVVGSEISGGFRNLFVENCQMDSPALERVVRIKTNTCRGGTIENIYVRNVEVGECREAVLKINLNYEPREKAERGHIPTVRNVLLENVNCRKSQYGAYISGLTDKEQISNVTVRNCTWSGVTTGQHRIEGKVGNLNFENCRLLAPHDYKAIGEQFVKSEMIRHPEGWMIENTTKNPKWNYTQGLEVLSMRGWMSDEEWVRYARSYTDSLISPDGKIRNYKMKTFKLDDLNSGKLLFQLYDLTQDKRYRIALDTLYTQVLRQPRTPEGGMWHKTIYPNQMWLDGQYMALPFYLEYVKRFGDQKDFDAAYDFVTQQIQLITSHTYCSDCRLYHHAWDAAHVQSWADKTTGRSSHAWGRAEGWFMMALVDCLSLRYGDKVPESAENDILVSILNSLTSRLLELQDPKTNTWQQVLDCTGREGNYQEMTSSAMFAYTFLKGARLGAYEDSERMAKEGRKALDGILNYYVTKDVQGLLSLENCCSVAGLSDSRNGSYEYYLSEKVIQNDPKGLGPLFMALLEELKVESL